MQRSLLVVAAWVVAAPVAHAKDPAVSPRLAGLTARVKARTRGAEQRFWKEVAAAGTPLVEDVKDPKGRLLVTFLWRGRPDTKRVGLYGAPTPGGHAYLARVTGTDVFAWSALLPPNARFTYLMAPDDDPSPPVEGADFADRQKRFRFDPLSRRRFDLLQSIVELPLAPPQPWLFPRRGTPAGELWIHRARSKGSKSERMLGVYTPPGHSRRGARHPLVVMFDARGATHQLAITTQLDHLIAARKIPPVVVLLIGSVDRSAELSLNPAFADFVALDLVPWVRREYHATSDPRRTVIAGISLGGLAASFIASRHPRVFGNVLSQSGSYSWSPYEAGEGEVLAHSYATRPRTPVRFWMEVGTLEGGPPMKHSTHIAANRHFRDVLLARGYEVTYSEFVGDHSYVGWRGTIAGGLIALLARPPRQDRSKLPALAGTPGGVEIAAGHRSILPLIVRTALLDGGPAVVTALDRLAASKEPTVLFDENEVNNAGYALLAIGRAREAIPIFEWNVNRFSRSSNAHDSLAEAHFLAGDRASALASYRRSFDLDRKNDNAENMIRWISDSR